MDNDRQSAIDVLRATADDFQLDRFNAEELCEIYHNLNVWQWDKRLGAEPYDISGDKYPNNEFSLIGNIIRNRIEEMVGHKAVLKHWNTKLRDWGRMTDDEFEVWHGNALARNEFSYRARGFEERYPARLRKMIARKRIKALLPVAISGKPLREEFADGGENLFGGNSAKEPAKNNEKD